MTDMSDDAVTVLDPPADAHDGNGDLVGDKPTFNYEALEAETRIVVQQRTNEIRDRMRRAAQDIVEIGERLADVRDRLDDGAFSTWLQAEFAWSRRTAYNCIAVYEQLGKRANFAQTSIAASALYLLAAATTPDEARDEVLARAAAGEPITHQDTKATVEKHKAAADGNEAADDAEPAGADGNGVGDPAPAADAPPPAPEPAAAAPTGPSPDQVRQAMTVNLLAVAYQEVHERWQEQFPDVDAWTVVPFDYEALRRAGQQMIGTTVQEMIAPFVD